MIWVATEDEYRTAGREGRSAVPGERPRSVDLRRPDSTSAAAQPRAKPKIEW
jgi:hypothetical protein